MTILLAEIDCALPLLDDLLTTAYQAGYEREHTQQVTRLALALYDQLVPLHRGSNEQRVWLHCAALLHDIGLLDGSDRHHKRSYKRILITPLPFPEPAHMIIALVARYHRRALPDDRHPGYRELSLRRRMVVKRLAAILRVADGLDRTHGSVITGLECIVSRTTITLTCLAKGPAREEQTMALEKSELLVRTFHRTLEITCRTIT